MVDFFISRDDNGEVDAHLCEMTKDDSTCSYIYISEIGDTIRISIQDSFVKRFSDHDGFNWEKTNGKEFIEAYMRASKSFHGMISEMFLNINNHLQNATKTRDS